MNKTELVVVIAEKHDLTKVKALEILDGVFNEIYDAVQEDGKVVIPGVATWRLCKTTRTKGRNPRTGEIVPVAIKKVIRCKVTKRL